jgi:hypothetical protein
MNRAETRKIASLFNDRWTSIEYNLAKITQEFDAGDKDAEAIITARNAYLESEKGLRDKANFVLFSLRQDNND